MDGLLKSDIFFFITSIAVIGLGIAGLVIMFQVYKLLQEIRQIARTTRQGAEWLLEDFDEMREAVREKGLRLRFFLDFFRGIFERKSRFGRFTRRKPRKDEDDDTLND